MADRGMFTTIQIAWLIATVGSVIAQTQSKVNTFIWWTIAYQMCCLLAVTFVIGYSSHHRYSMAVSSTRWVIRGNVALTAKFRLLDTSRPVWSTHHSPPTD